MHTLLLKSILILSLLSTRFISATYYTLLHSLFDSLSPEEQQEVIAQKTQVHFTPGYGANEYEFYRHDSPPPDAPRSPEAWAGQYAAYFESELINARDDVQYH